MTQGKTKFGGKVFFLNRSDINTDEIIPAKYLTYIDREPLKPFLLEDLKIEGLNPKSIKWDEYQVIISDVVLLEKWPYGHSKSMVFLRSSHQISQEYSGKMHLMMGC